jgi:hypothetical protein
MVTRGHGRTFNINGCKGSQLCKASILTFHFVRVGFEYSEN